MQQCGTRHLHGTHIRKRRNWSRGALQVCCGHREIMLSVRSIPETIVFPKKTGTIE